MIDTINWDVIGHTLAALFVMSVFYETALSAIFNWRLYQVKLKDKGLKVPVLITVAIAVFWEYELDLFTPILNAMGLDKQPTYGGILLTALVVAGGSGGINAMLKRFGIRKPKMGSRPLPLPLTSEDEVVIDADKQVHKTSQ